MYLNIVSFKKIIVVDKYNTNVLNSVYEFN